MADNDSIDCAVGAYFSADRLGATVVKLITVHLAFAETAQRQHYLTLQVTVGTTLYEALAQAGWLTQFPHLGIWCEQVADIMTPAAKLWHVGIYAQKQPLSYLLQPLDRIEVYRSLSADPMSQRKTKSNIKVSR